MKKLIPFLCSVLLLFCSQSLVFAEASTPPACSQFETVKASHILVNTKEEAVSIKSQIDKGANFEEMAKKHSKCPSGNNGGNLGYFGKGEMVPSFETAAFNLPVGKVSDPIKTQFGWHIIKVYDKE